MSKRVAYIVAFLLSISTFAMVPQDDKTQKQKNAAPPPKEQPILAEEEEIPDSLLHPRWKIKKTSPVFVSDLDSSAVDLRTPDNIKQQAEYNDSLVST